MLQTVSTQKPAPVSIVKPTKKLHPIVYIAASAVAGIVFSFAGA